MIPNARVASDRGDEVDFMTLVRIAWAYKYVIVTSTALFAIASIILALTATHKFTAQVIVTEANDGGMGAGSLTTQFGGLASLAGVDLMSGGMNREAEAVLESRKLISEFIERNDLVSEILQKAEQATLWFAVRQFQDTVLTINHDTNEGTTTVTIEWTDPEVAAEWANQFVALANELMRMRALEDATRNIEFLNRQIERTNVVEVQRALYNLIESETKNLMLANVRAEYAFRVIDPAVPPQVRSSPKRKVMVLTGTTAGFFVGLFAVLTVNFVRRLRIENQ